MRNGKTSLNFIQKCIALNSLSDKGKEAIEVSALFPGRSLGECSSLSGFPCTQLQSGQDEQAARRRQTKQSPPDGGLVCHCCR